MSERRVQRLNSLLKEVLSDVIRKDVKNSALPQFITITAVEITKDLRHAKVFVSVIGDEKLKQEALSTLQSAAGFIAIQASKQVVMRYFPELLFVRDDSIDKQIRIETLISEIQAERRGRESHDHANS
jgi:ribosome-binding factor A